MAAALVLVVVGVALAWPTPDERSGGATASRSRPVVEGPVAAVDQDAPDPDLLLDGDEWFMYTTNAEVQGTWQQVPAWRSVDGGDTWVPVGDVLPAVGSWAVEGRTWAPSVHARTDGSYVLHYTAQDAATGMQCIGAAVSSSPTGPFVDVSDRPVICQHERGGSIDPDVYLSEDGEATIVWKSDGNNPDVGEAPILWSQPLDASGTVPVGVPSALVEGDTGDEGVIEGPSMFDTPGPGVGLLYSSGWWESDGYRMQMAWCESPAGPCRAAPWEPPPSRRGGGGSVARTADGLYLAYHEWSGPTSYAAGGVREAVFRPLPSWLVPGRSW